MYIFTNFFSPLFFSLELFSFIFFHSYIHIFFPSSFCFLLSLFSSQSRKLFFFIFLFFSFFLYFLFFLLFVAFFFCLHVLFICFNWLALFFVCLSKLTERKKMRGRKEGRKEKNRRKEKEKEGKLR